MAMDLQTPDYFINHNLSHNLSHNHYPSSCDERQIYNVFNYEVDDSNGGGCDRVGGIPSTDLLNGTKIMVMGAPGVGKSTLISRLVKANDDDCGGLGDGVEMYTVDATTSCRRAGDEVQVWHVSDGKGNFDLEIYEYTMTRQRYMPSDSCAPDDDDATGVGFSPDVKRCIADADIFLLVYSVDDRESFDVAFECHDRIGQMMTSHTTTDEFPVPIFFAGNKTDSEERGTRVISTAEAELRVLHWDRGWNMQSTQVSALRGDDDEFVELKRTMYETIDVPIPPEYARTAGAGKRRKSSLRKAWEYVKQMIHI